MSCNCNDAANDADHVPCSPCAAAAKAMVSVLPPHSFQGSQGLGAATDDLTTIQQFLQTLTSGIAPTTSELAAAQAAATSLSADVFAAQKTSMPPNAVAVNKTALVMGGIALVLGGASLTYLYKTSSKRRRR